MTLAVNLVLVLAPVAYVVVLGVVFVPGLRRVRRLSQEARRSEDWPRVSRTLTVRERIQLARRTAKGEPVESEREAQLLVARADFTLRTQQYLAERGFGPEWMAKLLLWLAGGSLLLGICTFVQTRLDQVSGSATTSSVVLLAMAVYLGVLRLFYPRIVERAHTRDCVR